jgi:hypothetical protein
MKTFSKASVWRVGGVCVIAASLALSSAATAMAAGSSQSVDPPGIRVEVSDAEMVLGQMATSTVSISLQDLPIGVQGVQVHLTFDPAIVTVGDADHNPSNGTQVTVNPIFGDQTFVGQNRVDPQAGAIQVAVAQINGEPITDTGGLVPLATIQWVGAGEGCTTAQVAEALFSDADGFPVGGDIALQDGNVCVTSPGKIRGCVHTQGRVDHSGVLVTAMLVDPGSNEARTDLGGCFEIAVQDGDGCYVVSAFVAGYLASELAEPVCVSVGEVADVGPTKLWGGEVTGDHTVDIRDVTYIAARFGGTDSSADITKDGSIDILDLSMAAANFGKTGPTSWQDDVPCDFGASFSQ